MLLKFKESSNDRVISTVPGNLLQAAHYFLILLLLVSALPVTSIAATDTPPNGQPASKQQDTANDSVSGQQFLPMPPLAAREICNGKNEGDDCSFKAPHGIVNGTCLTGRENVFACRPMRGPAPAAVVQEKTPEKRMIPLNSVPVKNNTNKPPDTHSQPSVQPATNLALQQQKKPPGQLMSPGINATESFPANQTLPGSALSFLLVAMGAAGLTWYRFYRYSTVPLRRLRKVTQQLAGGDLSARVGEGLDNRRNEVADLGRDVDRMAERIESLVGAHQRLIRDVSHELRSPLSRLNVALELARQSAGPSHSAPFDRIERESDRLNELIGQLLMLTKLESESGSIKRGEFDITALVVEIVKDADFEVKNNNRQVVATVSEEIMLNGNSELLRQAIENLVRNAVRYTEQGTPVEISIKKKMANGRNWVHIEVRDHGPGVPESALYDIFRPFYRVNDARERQSGGTGVGLAISDRAVRLHGGSLRAFNAPGGGLVMKMELPLM